ncbi:MAG TPA: hypothetical protein VLZ28_00080, partial [Daejeonella sp.]|nr:hypothetical protein [Daejeonella sp.]
MQPKIITVILIILITLTAVYFYQKSFRKEEKPDLNKSHVSAKVIPVEAWVAPDTSSIPRTEEGELIWYGRRLITHTSEYLGPKGSVAYISNGMNCQNCHLDAGTKSFSNNFARVSSGFPRYRPRSGRIESIEFRVNDCLERSLNGQKIDSLSKEMRAFVAYFRWIGKDVTKEDQIADGGVGELPLLNRAANPITGQALYLKKCKICHGSSGEGLLRHDSAAYVYPPLWGANSYNTGAGMLRLTRLSGFI